MSSALGNQSPPDLNVDRQIIRPEGGLSRAFRKRSRNACLSCRTRKVRCDVARLGVPCTNCTQDEHECVVQARKRRSRAHKPVASPEQIFNHAQPLQSPNSTVSRLSASSDNDHRVVIPNGRLGQVPLAGVDGTYGVSSQYVVHTNIQDNSNTLPVLMQTTDASRDIGSEWTQGQDFRLEDLLVDYTGENISMRSPAADRFDWSNLGVSNNGAFTNAYVGPNLEDIFSDKSTTQFRPPDELTTVQNYMSPSSAMFAFTSWQMLLEPGDLTETPAEDTMFLQAKGCLHVPSKPLFLELILAYFRYVHPSLPMIDEGDFWHLWSDTEQDPFKIREFSLFVVQSMLFAACAYVSEEVIMQCGFQTIREARSSFYSRAKKLLFDFEVEKSPLYRSYGSVLLTYHAPNANENRVNTSWLMNAIGSARIAGAHEYHAPNNRTTSEQLRLKKLWWCCIIRDRILPLGVRRPLQIGEEHLNSAADIQMSLADFESELGRSRVYDTLTQKKLFQVFLQSCSLAISLTTVISLVYAGESNPNFKTSTREEMQDLSKKLDAAESNMLEWFENTALQFTPPLLLDNQEDPVILFVGVLYMFYSGAMLAIYNRQALLLEIQEPTLYREKSCNIATIQSKLVAAMDDTTDRLTEIFHAKLTKFLPLSVCAYLTFPMVLHLFGIKSTSNRLQFALRRRAFEVYAETMKLQKALFNGTDFVVDVIEEASRLIETSRPVMALGGDERRSSQTAPTIAANAGNGAPVEAWQELLTANPFFYLRLVTQLDISFSTGARPEEAHFPVQLQLVNLK